MIRGPSGRTELQRFFRLVDFGDGDGCWTWIAGQDGRGYGVFVADGRKTRKAYRWLYQAVIGAVPAGLELDHLCRNRACVRWDHLEPVTHLENMRRSPLVRQPWPLLEYTHCKKGGHRLAGSNVIASGGKRRCRTCYRAYRNRWRREKAEANRREPSSLALGAVSTVIPLGDCESFGGARISPRLTS